MAKKIRKNHNDLKQKLMHAVIQNRMRIFAKNYYSTKRDFQ